LEGKKERWQDKPCEYRQGCKHKSTGKFMRAAKQWVMQECMVRGYNQVNLLARSGANNYWVEKRGKENNPDFKTNKDMIRERLDDLIEKADDLEHLTYYLENVEDWHIRVTNKTISDLDYDIRYHNPYYQSYVENQVSITQKQSYINQWTKELAKCNLFQRDLKKMYNEQIKEAEGEIAELKTDNQKIFSKASCGSEDELRRCQNDYEQKRKLLDTLAERNRSIDRESEALKENYENLISQLDEPTREKFITDKKEYQKRSDAKAEAILKDMYAEEYSGMDVQTAMVRVENELQDITETVRGADGMVRSRDGR
jgi:DNA repair exonuclease SbcCD ATPase subunit